jgi:Nif-specific regulatory protein
LTTSDDVIHGFSLPPSLQTSDETDTPLIPPEGASLTSMIESYEREIIIDALKKCRGNAAAVARELKTTQRIINYRISQLSVNPSNYKIPAKTRTDRTES